MSEHEALSSKELGDLAASSYEMGKLFLLEGSFVSAREKLVQALKAYTSLHDMVGEVTTVAAIATVDQLSSDRNGQLREERETILRINESKLPEVLLESAHHDLFGGRTETIEILCEAARTIARRNGDMSWLSKAWLAHGDLQRCLGNAAQARVSFDKAGQILEQEIFVSVRGEFLWELGLLHRDYGKTHNALLLLEEACQDFMRLNEKAKAAQVLLAICTCYSALGKNDELRITSQEALKLAITVQDSSLENDVRSMIESMKGQMYGDGEDA